ncbi:hypothetical protein MN608_00707 [Microdochium nivale]|nr:hypothetical protein MN608_00707 [Microdochium nivale]
MLRGQWKSITSLPPTALAPLIKLWLFQGQYNNSHQHNHSTAALSCGDASSRYDFLRTPLAMGVIAWRLPFVLHIAVESIAVFLFTCRPTTQLHVSECSPQARLVLRQYGALLMSSNLVCLAIVMQPEPSSLIRHISWALLVYHVFPCHRAWVRMQEMGENAEERRKAPVFARPGVHLTTHVAVCVSLIAAAC